MGRCNLTFAGRAIERKVSFMARHRTHSPGHQETVMTDRYRKGYA